MIIKNTYNDILIKTGKKMLHVTLKHNSALLKYQSAYIKCKRLAKLL